jgi:hypothetical protein
VISQTLPPAIFEHGSIVTFFTAAPPIESFSLDELLSIPRLARLDPRLA